MKTKVLVDTDEYKRLKAQRIAQQSMYPLEHQDHNRHHKRLSPSPSMFIPTQPSFDPARDFEESKRGLLTPSKLQVRFVPEHKMRDVHRFLEQMVEHPDTDIENGMLTFHGRDIGHIVSVLLYLFGNKDEFECNMQMFLMFLEQHGFIESANYENLTQNRKSCSRKKSTSRRRTKDPKNSEMKQGNMKKNEVIKQARKLTMRLNTHNLN